MKLLEKDKRSISLAAKAGIGKEETQYESEETIVPRLNQRQRKTTKASENLKNYQVWD